MSEEEKWVNQLPHRTWKYPIYPFKPVAPMPPNTLTNADGMPYSAGHDDALKEAKLQELVFTALGEVSMCWSERPKGVFQDVEAKRIGDELIKQIKEIMSQ